jgi:hypothetical protein
MDASGALRSEGSAAMCGAAIFPQGPMRYLALLLILSALAACDRVEKSAEKVGTIEGLPVDAEWRRLADGSFARSATNPLDPDRREADRCWPSDGGFDCLGVDDIRLPVGRIVVANRTYVEELPSTASVGARTGFSCAIYEGPVIEQRIIRDGAALLTNDSLDGALWSGGEVERLSRAGGGSPEGGYIDCTALASRIGRSDLAVIGATGLAKADVLPPLDQALAETAS